MKQVAPNGRRASFFMEIFFLLIVWLSTGVSFGVLFLAYTQHKDFMNELREKESELNYILEAAQTERAQLYDRIQAGTLPQYKEYAPEPEEKVEEDETVPLDSDDAKEDILNG